MRLTEGVGGGVSELELLAGGVGGDGFEGGAVRRGGDGGGIGGGSGWMSFGTWSMGTVSVSSCMWVVRRDAQHVMSNTGLGLETDSPSGATRFSHFDPRRRITVKE